MARLALTLAPALWVHLCGCVTPAQIDRLVGEVHLHQTPASAYVHALFIDPPTPVAQAQGDSALPSPPSIHDEGGCQAYEVGGCAGGCNQPDAIDAGEVDIDGLSRGISLSYQAAFGGYDDLIFEGSFLPAGQMIKARGQGRGAVPAWEGSVRLAQPFEVASTLGAGLAGLTFDWAPGSQAALVEVLVSVTPQGTGSDPGRTRAIRCTVDDEAGHLRVPEGALGLMPPAPRVVQFEATRQELVRVPIADGLGVVLHGGYAVLGSRSEP